MRLKAKIFQKSIQVNKGNKFWPMKNTMKMFALNYAKLSKINGQTSVATEAGNKTYHKRETGNLPKLDFPFLNSFNIFSFYFQLRKILRIKNKLIQSFLKTFNN